MLYLRIIPFPLSGWKIDQPCGKVWNGLEIGGRGCLKILRFGLLMTAKN